VRANRQVAEGLAPTDDKVIVEFSTHSRRSMKELQARIKHGHNSRTQNLEAIFLCRAFVVKLTFCNPMVQQVASMKACWY